jgi:hypothetical protein
MSFGPVGRFSADLETGSFELLTKERAHRRVVVCDQDSQGAGGRRHGSNIARTDLDKQVAGRSVL